MIYIRKHYSSDHIVVVDNTETVEPILNLSFHGMDLREKYMILSEGQL